MSACASMCTTNMSTPQAAIIQGPPGTGKSTTIAAMVLQIIFRWKRAVGKFFRVCEIKRLGGKLGYSFRRKDNLIIHLGWSAKP